ncbi:MAG TPA: hypothetical protein VNB24_07110 [Acidimicrobiales bacterium]|nr:hypothetical protein [Acidimicrobiales bacterium]
MNSQRSRIVALPLALALLAGACGGDSETKGSGSGASADVEKTVRASLEAENEKDVDAFLALWTDKGLESYDQGSREDIKSGKSPGFGENKLELLEFSDTKATGTKATTVVDVAPTEFKVAKPLYRATFALIEKNDKWLIDGFDFKGSPPAPDGTKVIDIKAQDYAFLLGTTEVSGDVAFKFDNVGKEQHELTMYKGPDGVDIKTAKAALENVDGSELKDIPDGYKVDHISFADVGQKLDVTFAEKLKPGTYVLACYIPQGGFGDDGPVNPEGAPHIKLGMINTLTIK